MNKDLLIFIATIIILVEIYRKLRQVWQQHLKMEKKKNKPPRKPAVLRPKSERDCRFCLEDKGRRNETKRETPISWQLRKGKGGPKKKVNTAGYFCSNDSCEYYGITEEAIHALVGYGSHGLYEEIQDFKCQACKSKFTIRRNTILYRLFRSGVQGRKLHGRLVAELKLVHVQLDELWANVKQGGQDMWLWVAHDAITKLIPVLQVGGRSQEMAFSVVHELKRRLAAGCVPVFSTDGLRHYYYALTAHFGKWERGDGKKPVWVLLGDFIYGQVIKHQRRRKTVEVERRVLVGEAAQYRERLSKAGLSGRINTSFVERLNLTIRQSVSKLTRRTWGPARYSTELLEHLEWWRMYYHFVRPHESLAVELIKPAPRKGRQIPRKYQKRTPAMAAGLTERRWTVRELISYPLL